MENIASVVTAIESFDAWQAPWQFSAAVSQALKVEESQLLFRQVWSTACASAIWQQADTLNAGAELATAALERSYPWLTAVALRQLTNAASYQWR